MSNAVKALAVVVVLTFAMSALAANSTTFSLSSPAKLGQTQVAAGQYNLTWEGTGSDVKVTVTNGNKKNVIATLNAKLVQGKFASPSTAVLLKTNGGAAPVIAEIQVGGKKAVLIFEN